ncbi:MAG: hypothetical protein NT166_28110 [Candidatus Aminicenantes bacterium]|nr:hypothetical protein [Candidatus Aminicenantes bacterium]
MSDLTENKTETKCPVCDLTNTNQGNLKISFDQNTGLYDCERCGKFKTSGDIAPLLEQEPYCSKRHLITGYIREKTEINNIITISPDNIQHIIDSAQPDTDDPLELLDRLLWLLYKNEKTENQRFSMQDYPVIYAKSKDDICRCFTIGRELEYLNVSQSIMSGVFTYSFKAEAWKRIKELKEKSINSKQIFVALAFVDDIKNGYMEGIRPLEKETGYNFKCLAFEPHNENIPLKIITEIRKSGLLVADLTYNKQNVYFEAGYAKGLGIPVIWTCRDSDSGNIHSDVSQYHILKWKDYNDLKENLKVRIEYERPLKK